MLASLWALNSINYKATLAALAGAEWRAWLKVLLKKKQGSMLTKGKIWHVSYKLVHILWNFLLTKVYIENKMCGVASERNTLLWLRRTLFTNQDKKTAQILFKDLYKK